MAFNFGLCPSPVQNMESFTFYRYISIFPASTHSAGQHQHLTKLPFYHPYTEKNGRWIPIGGRPNRGEGYRDSDLNHLDLVVFRQYTTVTNQCYKFP